MERSGSDCHDQCAQMLGMETIHKNKELNALLHEFEEAIQTKNDLRAARIAKELGKPRDEIKELCKKAIRPFILDFRNPQGAAALIEDGLFTKEERDDLFRSLLHEAGEKGILDKRQFDIRTMRYLTLREWLKEYFE